MDDELILDDSPELEEVIPEPETAPEEIQDVAQFYKGDPFRYSDFTPEQLEALKVKGDPGRGIASIDLTNTTGKVKTYTITFTDETTTTFQVVDGNDGSSQYQSYLDTTSDNPPLSEAEWSAVSVFQKKNLYFENKTVAVGDWVADTTYADYGYKAVISCANVTSTMLSEVTFAPVEADSGNYAAICLSGTGTVTIYAKSVPSGTITIPTIKAETV